MRNNYYSYHRNSASRKAQRQKRLESAAYVAPSILDCYLPAQSEQALSLALSYWRGKRSRTAQK